MQSNFFVQLIDYRLKITHIKFNIIAVYLLRKLFQSLLFHIYTKGIEGLDLQDCAPDLSARFDQFVEIFK